MSCGRTFGSGRALLSKRGLRPNKSKGQILFAGRSGRIPSVCRESRMFNFRGVSEEFET